MPLYDYECKACEFMFDEMIRMADREKTHAQKMPGVWAKES